MASALYSYTVPPECGGMSLRAFLRRRCGLTAAVLTMLRQTDGGITRNGVTIRTVDKVDAGDVIILDLPDEHCGIEPVEGVLDILYEDGHLLIVNKPPFMPVHPVKAHQTDTLANTVSCYMRKKGEDYVFRALNRLDRNTSGCVIIAKDKLSYALTLPTVGKTYTAVCEGIITEPGVIDAPIALSPGSIIKRAVDPTGSRAVTHYTPVENGTSHTMLELCLETGRTHQIRCHLSSIGHPLAGDDMYGGSLSYIDRQALHCSRVVFTHPLSGERVTVTAEIPPEFAEILRY